MCTKFLKVSTLFLAETKEMDSFQRLFTLVGIAHLDMYCLEFGH